MGNIKWYHYILFLIIVFFCTSKIVKEFNLKKHLEIRENPKKYCHNPEFDYYIWVIQDLSYSEEYLKYMKNKRSFSKRVKFKFEVIPNYSQVYFLGTCKKDSLLSEIVCYYFKDGYGQFVRGYIYSGMLYDKPLKSISNPNGDKAMPL